MTAIRAMITYLGFCIFWYFISTTKCNRIDTTKIDMKSCLEITSIDSPKTSGITGDVYFVTFPNNDKSQLKTSQHFNMQSDQLYNAEYDQLTIDFTSCWKKISTITMILYDTNNREIISKTLDVTEDDYASQYTSTSTMTQDFSITISMSIHSYCGGTQDQSDGCSSYNLVNDECDIDWSPECNVPECNFENGECRHENAKNQLKQTSCIEIEYVTWYSDFRVTCNTGLVSKTEVTLMAYPSTVTDLNTYNENSLVKFQLTSNQGRADINWHYCWNDLSSQFNTAELKIIMFDASESESSRNSPFGSWNNNIEVDSEARTNSSYTFDDCSGQHRAEVHLNTYTSCDINGICNGEMLFNNQCDQQCNNTECQWDLTDCLPQPTMMPTKTEAEEDLEEEGTADEFIDIKQESKGKHNIDTYATVECIEFEYVSNDGNLHVPANTKFQLGAGLATVNTEEFVNTTIFTMPENNKTTDINWHYCWNIPKQDISYVHVVATELRAPDGFDEFGQPQYNGHYPIHDKFGFGVDTLSLTMSRKLRITDWPWGDGFAFVHLTQYKSCNLKGDCRSEWLNNNQCDPQCNIKQCNWDSGDCAKKPQESHQILIEAIVVICMLVIIITCGYIHVMSIKSNASIMYDNIDDQAHDIWDQQQYRYKAVLFFKCCSNLCK